MRGRDGASHGVKNMAFGNDKKSLEQCSKPLLMISLGIVLPNILGTTIIPLGDPYKPISIMEYNDIMENNGIQWNIRE